MVSKCANPDCAVPFRYLHQGRLFRFESLGGPERRRTMTRDDGEKKHIRRLEFFWLCEQCAPKMTLVFDKEIGSSVRARLAAHASAA